MIAANAASSFEKDPEIGLLVVKYDDPK